MTPVKMFVNLTGRDLSLYIMFIVGAQRAVTEGDQPVAPTKNVHNKYQFTVKPAVARLDMKSSVPGFSAAM